MPCLLYFLFYYIFAWVKVGKDPDKGTIIPLFSPPKGFSPAAIRYVMKMGYSNRVFAAAIVNMAVKGYVKIEDDDGDFTLARTNLDESVLSKGERKIAKKLFSYKDRIELKNKNHQKIKSAIDALKKSLKLDFEKINFARNSKYLIPGIIILESVEPTISSILFINFNIAPGSLLVINISKAPTRTVPFGLDSKNFLMVSIITLRFCGFAPTLLLGLFPINNICALYISY